MFIATALLLLAAPTTAQKVWVVDDNGGAGVDFVSVDAAVAAATDGDTILVRNGSYSHLLLDGRSLTVTAEAGHAPVLAGASVDNVPAGGLVVLDGLTMDGGSEAGLQVTTCSGPVWVEDCTMQGADGDGLFVLFTHGHPGIDVVDTTELTLTRCTVRAGRGSQEQWIGGTLVKSGGDGGDAVEVVGSSLAVYDSELHGGHGSSSSNTAGRNGGHGINLASGELFAVGSVLWSGNGGTGGSFIDPVFGWQCEGGGDAGDGIVLPTSGLGVSVNLAHVTFHPGVPGQPGGPVGSGFFCWPGTQGTLVPWAVFTVYRMSIDAIQLDASDPIREQQQATILVAGSPGDIALLVVSSAPRWLDLASSAGLGLVDTAGAWVLPLGVTSGTGHASTTLQIPDLVGPGESLGLFLQVLALDPVSGTASLGSATELTILDAAL